MLYLQPLVIPVHNPEPPLQPADMRSTNQNREDARIGYDLRCIV